MADDSLSRWRTLFSSASADIFEVIEGAIAIAAMDHPTELKDRREAIAEKLYAKAPLPAVAAADTHYSHGGGSRGSGDSDASLGEVRRINDCIANKKDDPRSEAALLESLRRLQSMPVSVETLDATRIGVTVNRLRKQHKSEQVRTLARSIVEGWRAVADEWLEKRAAAPIAATTTAPTAATTTAPTAATTTVPTAATTTAPIASTNTAQDGCPGSDSWKPSVAENDGGGQRRALPASAEAFEAKMAISKRKFNERCQQIEAEKKRRMIQVIEPPRPKVVRLVNRRRSSMVSLQKV